MLLPDLLFLVVLLSLAAWRLFAPSWRPKLRIIAGCVGVCLAAAHWALSGFTWQDVAGYPLLALSALPPIRTGTTARRIGRLAIAGIAAAALGVWLLPAVPTLPRPDGRYPVGTEIYRWTDAARDEPHTTDVSDRRSVIAQAWYPAAQRDVAQRDVAGGARIAYIDGINDMPSQVSGLPGFLMHRYDGIDTHAEASAPLARGDRPWPVVIFSPGYGAPRALYTGLATQLASRGFVVFVLDHSYESGVTQLPDSRVVGTHETFPPGQHDRRQYMVDQQVVRSADIRFVIDQLARPAALSPTLGGGRVEAARVAVIGHSFGGAVSAMLLSDDPRVVAAANIDGTPYGDLPDRKLTRPFLLLQSDLAESPHGDQFHNGNGKLLATMTAPGFRYELKHANHFSFTDAPNFLAPPARWLVAQWLGGARGPVATQKAAADILTAFLVGPLTGDSDDVTAAARRYPDVVGGPVKRNDETP